MHRADMPKLVLEHGDRMAPLQVRRRRPSESSAHSSSSITTHSSSGMDASQPDHTLSPHHHHTQTRTRIRARARAGAGTGAGTGTGARSGVGTPTSTSTDTPLVTRMHALTLNTGTASPPLSTPDLPRLVLPPRVIAESMQPSAHDATTTAKVERTLAPLLLPSHITYHTAGTMDGERDGAAQTRRHTTADDGDISFGSVQHYRLLPLPAPGSAYTHPSPLLHLTFADLSDDDELVHGTGTGSYRGMATSPIRSSNTQTLAGCNTPANQSIASHSSVDTFYPDADPFNLSRGTSPIKQHRVHVAEMATSPMKGHMGPIYRDQSTSPIHMLTPTRATNTNTDQSGVDASYDHGEGHHDGMDREQEILVALDELDSHVDRVLQQRQQQQQEQHGHNPYNAVRLTNPVIDTSLINFTNPASSFLQRAADHQATVRAIVARALNRPHEAPTAAVLHRNEMERDSMLQHTDTRTLEHGHCNGMDRGATEAPVPAHAHALHDYHEPHDPHANPQHNASSSFGPSSVGPHLRDLREEWRRVMSTNIEQKEQKAGKAAVAAAVARAREHEHQHSWRTTKAPPTPDTGTHQGRAPAHAPNSKIDNVLHADGQQPASQHVHFAPAGKDEAWWVASDDLGTPQKDSKGQLFTNYF